MASPSTHPFPWKTKTTTHSPSTTIYSSPLFSLTKRSPRISHFTKFSLDQNQNLPTPIGLRKTIGAASFVRKDETLLSSDSLISGESEEKEILLKLGESLLEEKKPLWRRLLFGSQKVRSILLLNVLALVYASNIPVVKEVEAIIDPAIFTVVRFSVAAIAFAPFVLRARGNAQVQAAGLELGFWASLGYLLQALGLLTSDAGRASFFSLFTVIVVPLIDGMLGATVPLYTWFGALMSILGVGLLESSGSPPCVGDLWTLLSAVFFGIHMLRTERISRNTNKENFLALLGYQVSVVAMFSTVWYLAGAWSSSDPGWDPGSWTWTLALEWIVKFPWIPALYTGIFSTGLCLWVEITAMRDVSATETAIIYGLEPLWGAGFAWFLLGERWGIIGWIGAALVLGGSLTVQIFGSLSPSRSTEGINQPGNQFPVSDQRNALPVSPIVVSSRKDVQDTIKKK